MNTSQCWYWRGPCEVWVPCGIRSVVAPDEFNTVSLCPGALFQQTEVGVEEVEGQPPHKTLTAVEYRQKYAKKRNGRWFYDTGESREGLFALPDDCDDLPLYKMTKGKMQRRKPVAKTVETTSQ